MPTMKEDTTLRVEPMGAREAVLASEGDPVEALGTQVVNGPLGAESWTKIQLLDVDAQPTGWAPTENIAFGGQPPESLDPYDFARQCWWVFLLHGANPYYMQAVALIRSALMNDHDNNGVGPFRFSQAEWDAGRVNPRYGLGIYRQRDISDWRMQSIMFGLSTLDTIDGFAKLLGRQPNWAELHLAQMIGAKAASIAIRNPDDAIDKALNSLNREDFPPGGATVQQVLNRYAIGLCASGQAPRAAKGSEALDQIALLLKEALDAVQEPVDDVSAEFLGDAPAAATPAPPDVKAPASKPIRPPATLPTPTTGGPPLRAGAGGALGELIAAHESGRAGYGAFNRGGAGDSIGKSIDFSVLTVEEIMAMQSLPRGDPGKLFAVGKYQMIPKTLQLAVEALKIPGKTLMSPSLQENLFRNYLVSVKRPEIQEFIVTGDNSKLRAAQIALAQEFASVGMPDTGLSFYAGQASNKASITPQAAVHTLAQEHLAYVQNLKAKSPADAWTALSPGIT